MSQPLPLELELAEADAWSSMWGDEAMSVGPAVLSHAAGTDSLLLNRVEGLGIARPATGHDLDEIAEIYGETRHAIAVAPSARPRELETMLAERGYSPGYAWVKFVQPAVVAEPVDTDLRVELIGPEFGAAFAGVVNQTFGIPDGLGPRLDQLPGRPGWSCYLAFAGDEPAAAGGLHVGPAGAWLGLGSTLPEYRRRGAQGALMAARVGRAAELGAAMVVTETGENTADRPSNSYRNILRHGFKIAYVRPNLVSGGA